MKTDSAFQVSVIDFLSLVVFTKIVSAKRNSDFLHFFIPLHLVSFILIKSYFLVAKMLRLRFHAITGMVFCIKLPSFFVHITGLQVLSRHKLIPEENLWNYGCK